MVDQSEINNRNILIYKNLLYEWDKDYNKVVQWHGLWHSDIHESEFFGGNH